MAIRAFVASQENVGIMRLLRVKSSNTAFESFKDLAQMSPLQKKNLTQMCPFKFLDLSQITLIYALLLRI